MYKCIHPSSSSSSSSSCNGAWHPRAKPRLQPGQRPWKQRIRWGRSSWWRSSAATTVVAARPLVSVAGASLPCVAGEAAVAAAAYALRQWQEALRRQSPLCLCGGRGLLSPHKELPRKRRVSESPPSGHGLDRPSWCELALGGRVGHGVSSQIFAATFRGQRGCSEEPDQRICTRWAACWLRWEQQGLCKVSRRWQPGSAACLWALADSHLLQYVLNQPPSPNLAAVLLSGAAKGVLDCHSLGSAHCNIKPESFLIHFGKWPNYRFSVQPLFSRSAVVLFNFGLCRARVAQSSSWWTPSGLGAVVWLRAAAALYVWLHHWWRASPGARHPECPFYLEGHCVHTNPKLIVLELYKRHKLDVIGPSDFLWSTQAKMEKTIRTFQTSHGIWVMSTQCLGLDESTTPDFPCCRRIAVMVISADTLRGIHVEHWNIHHGCRSCPGEP